MFIFISAHLKLHDHFFVTYFKLYDKSNANIFMNLAIFDLDNTLLADDSDCLWGKFLIEQGYVDAETHQKEHEYYYRSYLNGNLDIAVFSEFQFRFLAENDMNELLTWREPFIEKYIRPIVLEKAVTLINKHREQKDILLIITATNSFITKPIAELLNIDHLIATEPEISGGQYTGKLNGIASFAEGKVTRYEQWLQKNKFRPEKSWFYSDSHNDIPLLSYVTYPTAVDPDDILSAEAKKRNWPVISLR